MISDGNKITSVEVTQMTTIIFEDFMIKCILKIDILSKKDIQKVYNYPIYPRVSMITTDKGFVIVDSK